MTLLGFILQWFSSVAVLLLASALLAEEQKQEKQATQKQSRVGKRAVEMLLRAFERLGVPVESVSGVLLGDGGDDEQEGGGEAGAAAPTLSQTRKRDVARSARETEEPRAHVSLEGVSLSFGDIRIVDNKYACYRIGVAPSTGPPWEVWRRMADVIKLKSALGKISGVDVDLPQLPHSYRRSFDASHLTRRRRRIQRFLQVVLAHPALRSCDVFREFLSPEFVGVRSLVSTLTVGSADSARGVPPANAPELNATSSVSTSASTSGQGGGGGLGGGGGGDDPSHRPGSHIKVQGADATISGEGAGVGASKKNNNDDVSESDRNRQTRGTITAPRAGAGVGGVGGGGGTDVGGGDDVGGAGSGRIVEDQLASPDGERGVVAQESGGGGKGVSASGGDSTSGDEVEEDGVDTFATRTGSGAGCNSVGGTWGVDGSAGSTPPWSPPDISPRNSGRKSMDYMRNAVMTGTRRIARSVPMSMPNPKTIQKHIPLPKGVPKFPKYNPYRRSSARRTTGNDGQSDGMTPLVGSPFDSMHGSSTHNEPSATFTARHGLTMDASVLSAYADAAAAPGGAVAAFAFGSPPRKGIWKRNSKTSGGGHGGACYNVNNGGSAPTPPALTEDTRPSARGRQQQIAAEELDATLLSDSDAASGTFDTRAVSEATEDWDGRAAGVGGGGGGGGGSGGGGGAGVGRRNGDDHKRGRGAVIPSVAYLAPGCSDGGGGHTFEVPAGPAVCPLVYADLFTTRPTPEEPAASTEAEAVASPPSDRRVDHVAVKGRCGRVIAGLTGGAEGHGGDEGGKDAAPFLFVVNFQIPGNPPLNLVAAWALQPEWLSPDCPERLRQFFGVFYRFLDIPLSSSLPPASPPAVPKTSPASPSSSRGTADERGRGNASERSSPLDMRPSVPVVVAAAAEKCMTSAAAAARVDREGGGGVNVGTGGGRSDGRIGVAEHGVGSLELGGRARAGRRPEEGGRVTPSPVGVGGGDVSGTSTKDRAYPWQSSDDESEARNSVPVPCVYNGTKKSANGTKGSSEDADLPASGHWTSRSRNPQNCENPCVKLNSDSNGVLPSDDLRNRGLRLKVSVVDGPSLVKTAIPSGDFLLGQKATLRYWRGERYMEVDVDLASGLPSSQLTSLCRQHSKNLTLDVGLVLQGEGANALAESVLGVMRIDRLDLQDRSRYRALWEDA